MEGQEEAPAPDTNKTPEPEDKLGGIPGIAELDDEEKGDEEKPEGEEGEEGEGEEQLSEDALALQEELDKIVVVTPPRSPRM